MEIQACTVPVRRARVGSRYKLPGDRRSGRGLGGPKMLHTFFSFSIESDIIRQSFVILTVLAASGHLAYVAVCFRSPTFAVPQPTVSYTT